MVRYNCLNSIISPFTNLQFYYFRIIHSVRLWSTIFYNAFCLHSFHVFFFFFYSSLYFPAKVRLTNFAQYKRWARCLWTALCILKTHVVYLYVFTSLAQAEFERATCFCPCFRPRYQSIKKGMYFLTFIRFWDLFLQIKWKCFVITLVLGD